MFNTLSGPMRVALDRLAGVRDSRALDHAVPQSTFAALERRALVQFRRDGVINGIASSGGYVLTESGQNALVVLRAIASQTEKFGLATTRYFFEKIVAAPPVYHAGANSFRRQTHPPLLAAFWDGYDDTPRDGLKPNSRAAAAYAGGRFRRACEADGLLAPLPLPQSAPPSPGVPRSVCATRTKP